MSKGRGRGGPNPFEDESGAGNSSNPFQGGGEARLTPLLSAPPVDPYEGRAATKNGDPNPFDFDSDFKTATKEDTPILFGVDADDTGFPPAPTSTPATPAKTKAAPRRPTVNASGLTGWLRGGKADDEQHVPLEDEDDEQEKQKKLVPEWPYDYYHQTQQIYYDSVDAKQADEPETASYVTRPPDLPDIPTAVQNLSLVDFETTAEQRAIGIISTWIYDEGLMDELIVTSEIKNVSLMDGDASVQTSEGVEITSGGYPIEGTQNIDKEIDKLRNNTSRELALINARLNDGVAASGSEVQELVNAVTATKGDLGKLRELSTYIATGGSGANSALLSNYPKLKLAINARRNLARCFRELDFFAQIPATCDRLRDDMHNSEWTEEEWTTLRNVCREHVELQIFLVEAEAGMKARIDQQGNRSGSARSSRALRKTYAGVGGNSYASVDKFLEEHVTNVWELGDEIRLRVLSGVGTTFDLALNNPAGMVALVEAVELYEAAREEYKAGRAGDEDGRLKFTDMRRGALEQVAKDFEVRGLEVFQEVQQMAADTADEDAATANFNAVLRASNNLTNQMDFVTHQMAPCFPKYWALEALWTSVVADVCSQQILGQIGGKDAQRLPDLTVTQLLDLVAWIESFREKIEDAFPDILGPDEDFNGPKPSIESGASLLHGDGKVIDVERAKESVKWVSSVLWEVHRLAQDEFLVRTRSQAEEWLENVYTAEHAKSQSAEGRLTTSLCEDVYALVGVQLVTIRERLTKRSEVLVLAVGVIFSYLRMKQLECRDHFLTDLETCCAAANDFIRMSEQCEEILADLEGATNLSKSSLNALEAQSNELLALYSSDAVYAAQRVHVYIFEPIEEEIGDALFSLEWEESLTHNELALTLVRTLEDYMGDLEIWLEPLMVRKVVDGLVISTINFYIKSLLKKTAKKKESTFKDPQTALLRIKGDIAVIREYFDSLTDTFPALERVIENEFGVLEAIHEMMLIAAGLSSDNVEELIFVLQRRIKDINLTRLAVGDLWYLVNAQEERAVYEIVDEHENTLNAMAPTGQDPVDQRNTDTGLRLDQVILLTVGQSTRKRPLKPGAVASMEKMMTKFKVPWNNGGAGAETDEQVA